MRIVSCPVRALVFVRLNHWIFYRNDLYCSPNIVRVIKSRRMRWAGHVARMDEERGCIGSWWGNRTVRHHWGDLGVDGWIILGRMSRRWDVGIWAGPGQRQVADACECGNEPSGSMKCGEFLD